MWRRRIAMLLALLAFGGSAMGAESCKEGNEKLKRDSRELEEAGKKLERERGCEPQPPFNCPKAE